MSEKYNNYLKTDYWKAVSDAVKKRAGYRCQLCNSQHDLQAHHRCYDHRGRELDYLEDLVCLCRRCHGIFHGTVMPAHAETIRTKKQKRERIGRSAINVAEVNADMPCGDSPEIELTHELIEKCRTAAGAFTNASLRHFGLVFPLITGWPIRLIGQKVTREKFKAALEGRYLYNTGRLPTAKTSSAP